MSPAIALPYDGLRQVLAWPARLLDRWAGPTPLPHLSPELRRGRLERGIPTPEAWLALQQGLATVGDDTEWASFAARGATALAVGGVHGPDRTRAYLRFREEAAALGLHRQAVYPVRAPDLDAAAAAGFRTLPIGTEAWVERADFTLRGKRFADLRQMVNRATKRGVVVEDVAPSDWHVRLDATWRAFLGARRVPWQIRWLSGAPDLTELQGRRVFVAHRDGVVQAFCTVLPGTADRVGIDVMCRHPDAQPGSMETLLEGTLRQLHHEGAQAVSLGPCPLAGHDAQALPGALGALFRWSFGTELGNRWFGFRRLAAFKEKFRPQHEPVHLGIAPDVSPLSLYLVARLWALGD